MYVYIRKWYTGSTSLIRGLLSSIVFVKRCKPSLICCVDDYWRSIGDSFAVWLHSEECLKQFIHTINNMHSAIKFTAERSNEFVPFLHVDVKIFLHERHIITDLFTKPTDTHQYLHQRSCHPQHQKSTIPCSQALRLHHICLWESDYFVQTKELKQHLVTQRYNRMEVQHYIDHATSIERAQALEKSEKNNLEDRVPLVVTYHTIQTYPSCTKLFIATFPSYISLNGWSG